MATALTRALKSRLSMPTLTLPQFKPRVSMLDWHDDWNIVAIGALNIVQMCLWTGVIPASATALVWYADLVYFWLDSAWLAFVPGCVPAKVQKTLLLHHIVCLITACSGFRSPLCQLHMCNAWIVELQSWTHIAARRLNEPYAQACERVNTPLYLLTRFVLFPLTWFRYAHLRSTWPTGTAQVPTLMHVPLSIAHWGLYGLMLKWGHAMLVNAKKA